MTTSAYLHRCVLCREISDWWYGQYATTIGAFWYCQCGKFAYITILFRLKQIPLNHWYKFLVIINARFDILIILAYNIHCNILFPSENSIS